MGETKLTEKAHDVVRAVVRPGDVAIDATVGNGHDTRFLADLVGPAGTVFGFDVQPAALTATADRLASRPNVALVEADHARMRELIPAEFHGRVAAVMFNLGYLPGGDHGITTTAVTTLPALATALELLKPGGVLTVVAYRGHPGGRGEAVAVKESLAGLPAKRFDWVEYASPNETGPVLFVVVADVAPHP
jgi:predicted methyltransferase